MTPAAKTLMPHGLAVIAIGAALAYVGVLPIGIEIGSALARAVVLAALGLAGLAAAARAGLTILPRGRHALALAVIAAVAVALAIVVLDGVVFRAVFPVEYRVVMALPLWQRLVAYVPAAFNEEIVYRLFLTSVVALVLSVVSRDAEGGPSAAAYGGAVVVAQVVNVAVHLALPQSAGLAVYETLRYVAPGLVWGYLYVRHGLLVAQAAHMAAHVLLQPVLGAVLT